jgi:mutator family transposase
MTRKKSNRTLKEIKAMMAEDDEFLRPMVRAVIQEFLEAEMAQAVGAEKGERVEGRLSYRSGYYSRSLVTRVGKLGNDGLIRIQATEFFRPKSHESEGDVLVDAELLELFRGFYARRKSEFVIESNQQPKHAATFGRYRCQDDIRALIGWLRAHGVLSRTVLHAAQRKRQSDQHSLRTDCRSGNAPPQRRFNHSEPLHRGHKAFGAWLQPSAQE